MRLHDHATAPLAPVLRRAGAVMRPDGHGLVASHYGSPAGELAVCLRTVGLADRSDLATVAVTGPPPAVAAVVRGFCGTALRPSGVATAAGAWVCAATPETIFVVAGAADRTRVLDRGGDAARHWPGLRVGDASAELAPIALLGPRALDVLGRLGVLGAECDPRSVPPFARVSVEGAECHLLLQSDRRALLLAAAGDAVRVWRSIERAGRPFGISCVGRLAVERIDVLERMAGGSAGVPPA